MDNIKFFIKIAVILSVVIYNIQLYPYGLYAGALRGLSVRERRKEPHLKITQHRTRPRTLREQLKNVRIPRYQATKGYVTEPEPVQKFIRESGGLRYFLEIVKDAVRYQYMDPDRPVSNKEAVAYIKQEGIIWAQVEEDASDIRQARAALVKIGKLPPRKHLKTYVKGIIGSYEGDTFNIVMRVLTLKVIGQQI